MNDRKKVNGSVSNFYFLNLVKLGFCHLVNIDKIQIIWCELVQYHQINLFKNLFSASVSVAPNGTPE